MSNWNANIRNFYELLTCNILNKEATKLANP